VGYRKLIDVLGMEGIVDICMAYLKGHPHANDMFMVGTILHACFSLATAPELSTQLNHDLAKAILQTVAKFTHTSEELDMALGTLLRHQLGFVFLVPVLGCVEQKACAFSLVGTILARQILSVDTDSDWRLYEFMFYQQKNFRDTFTNVAAKDVAPIPVPNIENALLEAFRKAAPDDSLALRQMLLRNYANMWVALDKKTKNVLHSAASKDVLQEWLEKENKMGTLIMYASENPPKRSAVHIHSVKGLLSRHETDKNKITPTVNAIISNMRDFNSKNASKKTVTLDVDTGAHSTCLPSKLCEDLNMNIEVNAKEPVKLAGGTTIYPDFAKCYIVLDNMCTPITVVIMEEKLLGMDILRRYAIDWHNDGHPTFNRLPLNDPWCNDIE